MDTRVHVSLEVSDLEKSISFYSRLFRQTPTKIRADYANFRLETPQLHLALVHNPKRLAEPHSNRHYGVELFSDERLDGWLQAVKQSGVPTRVEEQTTCCYAVANKFWAQDPDGHEWEFWVRHAEAESMHGVAEGQCGTESSSCCTPESPKESTKNQVKSACCAPGKC